MNNFMRNRTLKSVVKLLDKLFEKPSATLLSYQLCFPILLCAAQHYLGNSYFLSHN